MQREWFKKEMLHSSKKATTDFTNRLGFSQHRDTEIQRITLAVGCWRLAVGCWPLAVGGQFWRICNLPALIVGIYNADNYRVLYSLSEFYRIKNPDIKRGRISNPPERAPERATKNFVSNSFLAFLRTPWRFFVSSSV